MKKPFKLILKFIIGLILFSCQEKENRLGINKDLYEEILKYQKENPIDKNSEKLLGKNHFIYQVVILPPEYSNPEDKNYSLFITLSAFGVGKEVKKNCYGVFEDEFLQKTIIYDEANFIDRFVEEKKRDNLEKYIVKDSPIIDIIYPVKMYNIVNGKINFINEMSGNNHRN